MKVKIGKYTDYYSAHWIADKLTLFGIPSDKCDCVGQMLSDWKWLSNFFDYINERNERKIKVHIDDYDVWSMDHTLSIIVVPMLERLKEKKHGSAMVDDEDVPDELIKKKADVHEKWDWVLDELIWTFRAIRDDDDNDEFSNKDKAKRVKNGLRLFGKYYFALWD